MTTSRFWPIRTSDYDRQLLPLEAGNPVEVLHVVRNSSDEHPDDLLPGEERHREVLLVLVNMDFHSAGLHNIRPVGVVERRGRVVRLELAEVGVEHAPNCKLSLCGVEREQAQLACIMRLRLVVDGAVGVVRENQCVSGHGS